MELPLLHLLTACAALRLARATSGGLLAGGRRLPETDIHALSNVPNPTCRIETLNADGTPVKSIALDNEDGGLKYTFDCEPPAGVAAGSHCLTVFNCTVSNSVQKFRIIDERGCTVEPYLFDHVVYTGDLSAVIANPIPIRFHGNSSEVRFNCVTRVNIRGNEDCEQFRSRPLDHTATGDKGLGAANAHVSVRGDVRGVTVDPNVVPPDESGASVVDSPPRAFSNGWRAIAGSRWRRRRRAANGRCDGGRRRRTLGDLWKHIVMR